jgi:beta-mannanase
MKKNNLIRSSLLYLFYVNMLLLANCSEPYRLDSRDRVTIDTIAGKQIDRIASIMDDTLGKKYNQNVQQLTDSLVEFQIKAIEEKLQNISKK